ncbi:MAG: hypothetical protein HRF50_02505 [Phycisphaerae bacterium]|jgi:hypothetical protein
MPTQTPIARSAPAEAIEDLPLISDEEIEAALSEIETDGAKSALDKLRAADGAATAVEDAESGATAGAPESIPESPQAADAGPSGATPADGVSTAAATDEPRSPAVEHGAETESEATPQADTPAATQADPRAETDAPKPDAPTGSAGNPTSSPAPPASPPARQTTSAGAGGAKTNGPGAPAATPGGRKVQFKIGSNAAPAEPAGTAKPADAAAPNLPKAEPSSPSETAPPPRTSPADLAPPRRASAWKRVGRALDCVLDVFDWPVRLLGASGRQIVGACALSLLLMASGALALRMIFPHPDAVAFLRQKRAELTQPPKPKSDAGGSHASGADKGASTAHGGGH